MSTPDPALEYMATTKIGEKGQLTVPKQFREDLGLGIGARLPFCVWVTASFCYRSNGTSLRMATPAEFFRALSTLFR
jgi:AbrB family looped-hinge helix DNA binding protein